MIKSEAARNSRGRRYRDNELGRVARVIVLNIIREIRIL